MLETYKYVPYLVNSMSDINEIKTCKIDESEVRITNGIYANTRGVVVYLDRKNETYVVRFTDVIQNRLFTRELPFAANDLELYLGADENGDRQYRSIPELERMTAYLNRQEKLINSLAHKSLAIAS